jgi:hypothetical protein
LSLLERKENNNNNIFVTFYCYFEIKSKFLARAINFIANKYVFIESIQLKAKKKISIFIRACKYKSKLMKTYISVNVVRIFSPFSFFSSNYYYGFKIYFFIYYNRNFTAFKNNE